MSEELGLILFDGKHAIALLVDDLLDRVFLTTDSIDGSKEDVIVKSEGLFTHDIAVDCELVLLDGD